MKKYYFAKPICRPALTVLLMLILQISQAQVSVDLNTHVVSGAPAGSVLEWHNGIPFTPTTKINILQQSFADTGVYFAVFHDSVNTCFSPSSRLVVKRNLCNSNTVNLLSHIPSTIPANVLFEWHSSLPPSNVNKLNNTQAAQVGSGTYYGVYHDTVNQCYSPAAPLVVMIDSMPIANAGSPLSLNCTTISGQIGTASVAGYTYSWSPSTGLNANNIAQPIASPSVTTTYTVTVTNANGCSATSSVIVNKDTSTLYVDAGASLYLNCITTSGMIGTTTVAGASYSWMPTSGLTSSTIAQPTASPSNTTIYTLTVTNTNGCTSTDTVTVFSSGAIASISAPSITSWPNHQYCFGSNVILKANGDSAATFNWVVPAGCPTTVDNSLPGVSSLSISNLSAACNGIFKVNQEILGCAISGFDSVDIDGGVKPVFNFVSTSCVNNSGLVTVNSTPSVNMLYSINGGAYQNSNILNVSSGANFVVAIQSQTSSCVGTYTGNCVSCANAVGCVNPPRDSLVVPSVACANTNISLQNYITNASSASFTTNGTGTLSANSTNATPFTLTYTPSANDLLVGSVIITATTDDPDGAGPCQAAVTSKYITLVNGLVAPTIVSNSPVCENSQLNFEAVNAVGAISWLHTNGYTSTNSKDSIINTPANMQGTLVATISAYGCSNVTASHLVSVIAAPNLTVNVTSLPEFCAGQGNGSIQVNVAGGTGNYTICYNGNLGNCVNGTNANFQYIAPGNYTVTVVDQACPNNVFSYPISVGAGATVASPIVPNSISVCASENIVLTGTTGLPNSTINWIHAGSNFNAMGNPAVRYNSTTSMSGIYIAKTIDINGCASLPVSVTVNVDETPVIDHVQVNCVGSSANVEVTATLSTGTLSYSLDGINYQTSPLFTNYAPGNYTLYVKNVSTNCIATDFVHVPNCACPNEPYVTIVHPLTSCGTTPISMVATWTNVANATWTTLGNGTFSSLTGTSPLATIYTPTTAELLAGEVHLQLTTDDPDNAGPCSPVIHDVVIKLVNDLQQPAITLNQVSFCTGDSITLMSNVATAVEWYGVGGFYDTKPNAIIENATSFLSGYYKVVVSGNGCASKQDSILVTIAPSPSLTIATTVVPETCEGHGNGEITVNVSGGSGSFKICSDFGINCIQTNTSHTFKWLAPSTYQIDVTDITCPNAHQIIPLTVLPGLMVGMPTSASYNNPVCAGEDLVLTATGPAGSLFMWTDVKNNYVDTGAILIRTNAVAEMSGLYKVQRIENGCASANYDLNVHVYDQPTIMSIDTMCMGTVDSGRIVVNASIGIGDTIEYALNNGAFQTSPIFDLLTNGLYEIKARAKGSDCSILVSDVELYCNCNCKDANVSVFPNPNNGTFTVNASLVTDASSILISVYELSGRMVYSNIAESKAGVFKHDINIQSYAAGAYMLKVNIDGEIYIRPILINK